MINLESATDARARVPNRIISPIERRRAVEAFVAHARAWPSRRNASFIASKTFVCTRVDLRWRGLLFVV